MQVFQLLDDEALSNKHYLNQQFDGVDEMHVPFVKTVGYIIWAISHGGGLCFNRLEGCIGLLLAWSATLVL
jgi:hypothetical protein